MAWSADRGERRTARRRIVVAAATVFFAAGGVIAALALRAPTLEPDAAAQPSGVAPVATPSVTPPPSSLASDAASAIVPPPPTAPRETISTSAPSTESPARKRGDRASRRRPSAATSTQRKATGPPAKQSGYLRLRVHPWAEVFVDGKRRGVTPLPLIELSPGVHSVILVNADLGVREAHQVRIGAGREALLKTVLTPPPIR